MTAQGNLRGADVVQANRLLYQSDVTELVLRDQWQVDPIRIDYDHLTGLNASGESVVGSQRHSIGRSGHNRWIQMGGRNPYACSGITKVPSVGDGCSACCGRGRKGDHLSALRSQRRVNEA